MASGQFLTLGFLAVIVLAAGGVAWLWYQRRARRQQRQSSWRELCLRLELTPLPDNSQVARGELPETDFLLHDTGSDWLVELPLAQPLLPQGMVLLSPKAPMLRPHLKLRPLKWGAASIPPNGLTWYVDWNEPAGKVEAPQAFLDEAAHAVQAHAPLRVEPRRLIQRLRADAHLAMNEVREAVKALDTTARRWREVAERHGLPQVQPLAPVQPVPAPPLVPAQPVPAPPSSEGRLRILARGGPVAARVLARGDTVATRLLAWMRREMEPGDGRPQVQAQSLSPSARDLLFRLLAQRDSWSSLCILNAGIPISLGLIAVGASLGDGVICSLLLCMAASFLFVQGVYRNRFLEVRGVWLWVMLWSTTFGATMLWHYGQEGGRVAGDHGLESTASSASSHEGSPPPLKKFKSLSPYDDAYLKWLERTTSADAPLTRPKLLALLLWGLPNMLWLGWVLMGWRQEIRQFR